MSEAPKIPPPIPPPLPKAPKPTPVADFEIEPLEPSVMAAKPAPEPAPKAQDLHRSANSVLLPKQDQKVELPGKPRTRRRIGATMIAWIISVVFGLCTSVGIYFTTNQLGAERAAHEETRGALESARNDAAGLQARLSALEIERNTLQAVRATLEADRAEIAEAARIQAEALAAMQATQAELQQRLQEEVKKGQVLISQQGGELVVDLIDQVVFDSGEAELNEKGKAVLKQVGETLARVPDKIIQVSGHTDSFKVSRKIAAHFPTNWELSTARATNVVHYLQDELKIPGTRLVAAGLAEFRPIASNRTKAGRSKNRRIEVRLLPVPKK